MKAASFAYIRPHRVEEVLDLLAEHGDEAKVLAGGQSLVPMLNLRLARPSLLVDINRVGLDDVAVEDGMVWVGALVRHATLERHPVISEEAPLLSQAAPLIGHAAIRTRGTIGGSLAHADPAAELGAVMVALDAVVVVRSGRGERTVETGKLFESPFVTTLAPDELIVAIGMPRHSNLSCCYREVAIRAGDFAVAGAAAALRTTPDGVVEEARIGLSGVAGTPLRAVSAEAALVGGRLDEDRVRAAGAAAAAATNPTTDVHGSADYRRHLAGVLTRRVVAEAGRSR